MSKLSSIEELFAGRHFDREVIILCVRWYLRTSSASGTWSR
jgi:transposase-like protein